MSRPNFRLDPQFVGFFPIDLATVEAIKADGQIREPLVVWRGMLIDGHTRYRAAQEAGLHFEIRDVSDQFADRDAVVDWIWRNQIATRRNLSPDQIYLMARIRGQKIAPALHRGASTAACDALARCGDSALINSVLCGNATATQAVNDAKRRGLIAAAPRPPRTPRTAPAAPAPPATVPEVLAAERAAARANDATKELKRLKKELVRLHDEVEFMHAAAVHPPRIHTPAARPKSGLRIADPVFLVSDLHYGETVTLEETLGRNEYSPKIARHRTQKMWDNMLWLRADMARTQSCDHTVLVLNGDIVSGDIHQELSETNWPGGFREQCDFANEVLTPGILAMAEATPGILHVICIGGNHGRLTHRQHIKNGTWHSGEHIGVYDPLRRQIGDRDGKIAWHIPSAERFTFGIHGRRMAVQHGTMIRSQGGIGGVLVPMNRWVHRTNDADLYLFGHFHEADAFGKIIKNGALIGPSAYTKWLGIEDRDPEQVAFVLDADAGVRRFERVSVT